MSSVTKEQPLAEGPLGFPLPDQVAFALEARLKELPREPAYEYRRTALAKGVSELQPGERADVSWISEESVDRQGDVILAWGMDDSQFALNPIVTLNHAYDSPPAGKSLWRKRLKEGQRKGVKAKAVYPARPANWPDAERWVPDIAYELVASDLLRGKSVGFLPLKVRTPTEREARDNPAMRGVRYVIEEWLLLEYACCFLPAQQNAVVEAVSKGRLPEVLVKALLPEVPARVLPLLPAEEVAKYMRDRLEKLDFNEVLTSAFKRLLEKHRGRV